MRLTKKTEDTLRSSIGKFQKVLIAAKARDLNESDTVAIITDILAEAFGYDKYLEITSELAIRGTYCDLAIKLGQKFQFLIECKAIGIDLKEQHIRQATTYGANKGIEWIILTNGINWRLYRLRFEQPLSWDQVFDIDITTADLRNDKILDALSVLSREGVLKGGREELYDRQQFINRYTIGLLLQDESVLKAIQKNLRRLIPDIRVEQEEVRKIIVEDVLRRDLVESEEASAAKATVAKLERKAARAKAAAAPKPAKEQPDPNPAPQA